VRIDSVLVDPVGLAAGQGGRIEFANPDDVVVSDVVDLVAVHVELGHEAVLLPDLLLLQEGRRYHVRVEDAKVADRRAGRRQSGSAGAVTAG